MPLTAPQPPPDWNHSPEDVLRLAKEAIIQHRAVADKISAMQPSEYNFESVFLALERAETAYDAVKDCLFFYQNVSPSKELCAASSEAESLSRDYVVDFSLRLDVFQAKLAAQKEIKANGIWEKLSLEEQRLVEKMVLDGKRAGLALPENERNILKSLQKEHSQACLEFEKNCDEEKGVVSFTEEELKGVPADVISGYKKRTEGSTEFFDVTHRLPDILPIFKSAENPATRERAYDEHGARLANNVPVLDKLVTLRQKISRMLGYSTWADYQTEIRMVKTGKRVEEFLDDLEEKLKPIGLKERDVLLALKKKEHEERNLPFDGGLYISDKGYYTRKFLENSLDLDADLVKEYFPVSVVVPAMLDIYQNLLGVRFEAINGSIWHPDVQQYSVWNKDATDESGFVGYCYLDLYPREDKFSHAAVWCLQTGYERPDGKRSYPAAAIVVNLAKPTPDRPALIRHSDVVSLFHELGHIFHELLSETKFSRFHGTRGPVDFGEGPSQMLENWCWEPKVLQKLSSHYKTQEPLSPELIEKIVKSRYSDVGLFYLFQVFVASFDIKLHSIQEKQDSTLLWNTLRDQIALVKSKKPMASQGAIPHLSSDYSAGMYGYNYSLVFAMDMYATVFKGDPLDPVRGKLYRDKVLKPGASRDELDTLEDFLGRPPNSDAFKEALFGSVM
ncbi:metallopeptidase MepB [Mycena rebaudengoi]|nr:metallopeptidase MepB [Mycena rebaudengoi]